METDFKIYLPNRFHFAVVCLVIDAQMTSQRGKNKKVAHGASGSLMFLLHNKYMKKYISRHVLNFPGEF